MDPSAAPFTPSSPNNRDAQPSSHPVQYASAAQPLQAPRAPRAYLAPPIMIGSPVIRPQQHDFYGLRPPEAATIRRVIQNHRDRFGLYSLGDRDRLLNTWLAHRDAQEATNRISRRLGLSTQRHSEYKSWKVTCPGCWRGIDEVETRHYHEAALARQRQRDARSRRQLPDDQRSESIVALQVSTMGRSEMISNTLNIDASNVPPGPMHSLHETGDKDAIPSLFSTPRRLRALSLTPSETKLLSNESAAEIYSALDASMGFEDDHIWLPKPSVPCTYGPPTYGQSIAETGLCRYGQYNPVSYFAEKEKRRERENHWRDVEEGARETARMGSPFVKKMEKVGRVLDEVLPVEPPRLPSSSLLLRAENGGRPGFRTAISGNREMNLRSYGGVKPDFDGSWIL